MVARWRKRTLDNCFTQWREYVLVRQQYSIITRVVTNKRVNKLLLDAWTAWRVSVGRHLRRVALVVSSGQPDALPVRCTA